MDSPMESGGVSSSADGYGGMDPRFYDALVGFLKDGTYPTFLDTRKQKNAKTNFRNKCAHFLLDERNVLMFIGVRKERPRTVIRKGEVRWAIKHIHERNNHCGQKFTIAAIQRQLYWRSVRRDVAQFLSECVYCERLRTWRNSAPNMDYFHSEPPAFIVPFSQENASMTPEESAVLDRLGLTEEGATESGVCKHELSQNGLVEGNDEDEEQFAYVEEEYLFDEDGVLIADGDAYIVEEQDLLRHQKIAEVSLGKADQRKRYPTEVQVDLTMSAADRVRPESTTDPSCSSRLPCPSMKVTSELPVAPSQLPVSESSGRNGIVAKCELPPSGPAWPRKRPAVGAAGPSSPPPPRRNPKRAAVTLKTSITSSNNRMLPDSSSPIRESHSCRRKGTADTRRMTGAGTLSIREKTCAESSLLRSDLNHANFRGDERSESVGPVADLDVVSMQKEVLALQKEVLVVQREYYRKKLNLLRRQEEREERWGPRQADVYVDEIPLDADGLADTVEIIDEPEPQ